MGYPLARCQVRLFVTNVGGTFGNLPRADTLYTQFLEEIVMHSCFFFIVVLFFVFVWKKLKNGCFSFIFNWFLRLICVILQNSLRINSFLSYALWVMMNQFLSLNKDKKQKENGSIPSTNETSIRGVCHAMHCVVGACR